ncbi:MAG: hypothetical protein H6625_09765 [Bdellovibrionaceae bacterium]|nr:hypothetical protein [Pseudobdellovibrionaceae bacterium]
MINLYLSFILLCVAGCSSSGTQGTIGQEDYDENNTAIGAAYRVDAMHIRRPMPSHSDWKPMQFYFKHCSEIGEKVYYSKTSYECTGPW